MAARNGVQRLASLYVMIERMRSVELRVASSAVDEAVCSAAIAAAAHAGNLVGGREAMASGRPEDWRVAHTARSAIEARLERIAAIRVEREVSMEAALHVHRASRLDMRQMECVVDRVRTNAEAEHARRAQAESDDRFAARRAWTQTRDNQRSMKTR